MKKILIIFAAIITAGITTGYVHAQEPTSDISQELSELGYILGILSFPAAGIYYATTGFVKKFVRSLAGSKEPMDVVDFGDLHHKT